MAKEDRFTKMRRLSVKELEKIAGNGSLSSSAANKELESRKKVAEVPA